MLIGAGDKSFEELQAMVGQTKVSPCFTSSSVNAPFHDTFSYTILTRKGKGIGAYVKPLSNYHAKENEFLFQRGSAFKILGIFKKPQGESGYDVLLEYKGNKR